MLMLIDLFCKIYIVSTIVRCNENLSYLFYTEKLPENLKYMPTIGNGHIGFTIFNNAIYLNGLYNGQHGLSHRARIPNFSNITLLPEVQSNLRISYSLNARTGVFEIRKETNDMRIIQKIYCHRYYNRIIVNQVQVYRLSSSNGDLKISIQQEPGNESNDIHFQNFKYFRIPTANSEDDEYSVKMQNLERIQQNDNRFYQRYKTIGDHMSHDMEDDELQWNNRQRKLQRDDDIVLYIKDGATKQREDDNYQNKPSKVCCIWNHIPKEIILNKYQQYASYNHFLAIDENCSVAKQEIIDVLQRSNNLILKSHQDQWKKFWNSFSIVADGNLQLSRAIYGSLFYLASALPSTESNQANSPYFGLSPTGLGRGGDDVDDYQGHNFWDTEIWMLPVVTQMDPLWTRQLLNYRFRMLDAAKDYAQETNYKGARFPWESAFTGTETTNPCCRIIAMMQHHITGDISFALQQYFSVTYDSEWLHNEGCPLAENIAEFWESRVTPHNQDDDSNAGAGARNQQQYDIKFVMGPDEDHQNVTNNVFTNVIASYALKFGEFSRSICSYRAPTKESSTRWIDIANNLKILYDPVMDYHPQFEGYTIGTGIKQADTILLGYPLMFPLNDSTRKNDLEIYEKVTRDTGPAMTWSMHAINHLDVGDYHKADKHFLTYKNYITPEFQVFKEVMFDDIGAVNFLTGVGGFIQSIINGYAGVRIFLDRMEINRPRCMSSTTELNISGIKYLGSTFKILASVNNESIVQCISTNPRNPLMLHDGDKSFQITKNFMYNILSKKIIIKPKDRYFEDWR